MMLLMIWASAFAIVFLLGLQSQFVREHLVMLSFFTSFLISICEVMILVQVPKAGIYEMIAFVTGGPCGIVTSIYAHKKIQKLQRRATDVRNQC